MLATDMAERRINPVLLDALRLEAESYETQLHDSIGRWTADMKATAAVWEPGPMPEEWEPSDIQETVVLNPPRYLFDQPPTTKEI